MQRVRIVDLQKMILWEELSNDVANLRCPYSGVQISAQMLFSDQVEIEHLYAVICSSDHFSQTRVNALRCNTTATP